MTNWMTKARNSLRHLRDLTVDIDILLSVGMNHTLWPYRIMQIYSMALLINAFGLKEYDIGLTPKQMLWSIPIFVIVIIIMALFDVCVVKYTQRKTDRGTRKLNPIQQEKLGRLKNIERYLAKRFNGEFREDWEWTDKDSKGGFEKYEDKSSEKGS